jgi:hypothetical protein
MDKLKDAAYKAAGKHFQLNSVPQLSQILYENLKLDQKASIKVKATLARGAKSTSIPVVSNSSSILCVNSTVISCSVFMCTHTHIKFYLSSILTVQYHESSGKLSCVRGIYAK